MSRTKIVATVGPASQAPSRLRALVAAGASVLRLNFSHGSPEGHRTLLARLRRSLPVDRTAVLADIQGPKIRLGEIRSGSVVLRTGQKWILDLDPTPGDSARASVGFPGVLAAAGPGARILLGDGNVVLQVLRRSPQSVECVTRSGGLVGSHSGLYLPAAQLRTRILTPKDRTDLRLAVRGGCDFVALSFVRNAQDVNEARRFLSGLRGGGRVQLIAKIERAEAVEAIDEILEVSDAVMIARGDLGIEVPLEELALVQKNLIARSRHAGKPTIVATQMLLSMLHSPRPTRAEATDVANAVLDGADAVMLSEESAVGDYPVLAVRWLERIASAAEAHLGLWGAHLAGPSGPAESVASAAVNMAESLGAAAIVTPTHSGRTARSVAAHRPSAPVVALSSRLETRRQLSLVWGVQAQVVPERMTLQELRTRAQAIGAAQRTRRNRPVVLTAGYPVEGRPTNLLTVVEPRRPARP